MTASTAPWYGLALVSEEHPPHELVDLAVQAEAAGFDFAMITDHYQPWLAVQGHAAHVWTVLGAIAARTTRITVGTGVVCPTMRTHPAVIAHAAATVAAMLPGRFLFGVGSGGALNEHIIGAPWPGPGVRLEMLEEALAVIRRLWSGRLISHRGRHFTVDRAQLWTLPQRLPPMLVAAGGPRSATLAGRGGDGMIATYPSSELVEAYLRAGGSPTGHRLGWLSVCWAPTRAEGIAVAHERWPIGGLSGELFQELRLPAHVAAATRLVRPDDVAAAVVTGPDPQPYLAAVRAFLEAGFTGVYLNQIGPDQKGFLDFWTDRLRTALPGAAA